ncbi:MULTISPECIES: LysR family transcriptional regulator [Thiomicrorhabdus]|uniref:LysR family transcriptional regulator n=1 Tax=Thiomicrorhabdus heinhorstiae TaxID=2748010 RepID=A0ABS0BUN0_9GAMM|nr:MULTISPECIES: LysR family transcriptional regulator [Thiomicrorhabdus]MBF6056768.1 LysR family transcriptional regulator [Thiomicrorhabdus heinhorstiae]
MSQLEEIRVFIRIVEAGSLSKASEQLNLAKSAVSRRLADLEKRLQTKLLQRTTRKSSLTPEGQRFYEKALLVEEALNDLHSVFFAGESPLCGRLRVSLPLSFGMSFLSPLIKDFVEQNPQLQVDVDFSDRKVDLIEEGFDLAFRIAELEENRLQARKMVSIEHRLCAGVAYIEKYGMPQTLKELGDAPFLIYENQTCLQMLSTDGKEHKLNVGGRIRSNNGDFIKQMVLAGEGLALLPDFLVGKALQEGDLVELFTDYKQQSLNGYIVYPQNRYLSVGARRFIDYLKQNLNCKK